MIVERKKGQISYPKSSNYWGYLGINNTIAIKLVELRKILVVVIKKRVVHKRKSQWIGGEENGQNWQNRTQIIYTWISSKIFQFAKWKWIQNNFGCLFLACVRMCPSIGFTFPRHGRINSKHNVNEILNCINVSVPEMVRRLFHRWLL